MHFFLLFIAFRRKPSGFILKVDNDSHIYIYVYMYLKVYIYEGFLITA